MKNRVNEYKNSMINIFKIKYEWSEVKAKKAIKNYDFDSALKSCEFVALHDDPELWVDAIYKWANDEEALLET